jgi:hypothetical protein
MQSVIFRSYLGEPFPTNDIRQNHSPQGGRGRRREEGGGRRRKEE